MECPVLVRHFIAADGPVEPRIDRREDAAGEARVLVIPAGGGQGQRQAGRVDLEEVDQVVRRLVEPTAAEVTARVREVQPLAPVRVPAAGFAIAHRRLEREDRLLAVLERLESGPDVIETRLERIHA